MVKENKETTSISLPPSLIQWLREESEKTGLSVSYIVRVAVEQYKEKK